MLMNVGSVMVAVTLTQNAPTQWEDSPALATLDTLAMENGMDAQVHILLFSQENVISIFQCYRYVT